VPPGYAPIGGTAGGSAGYAPVGEMTPGVPPGYAPVGGMAPGMPPGYVPGGGETPGVPPGYAPIGGALGGSAGYAPVGGVTPGVSPGYAPVGGMMPGVPSGYGPGGGMMPGTVLPAPSDPQGSTTITGPVPWAALEGNDPTAASRPHHHRANANATSPGATAPVAATTGQAAREPQPAIDSPVNAATDPTPTTAPPPH
jgi:hypothetical protein